ncbi:MAG: glycosyltransferase [Myxococcota bacterium]
MNIVMVTFGTQGDVQPFVALGTALKEKGHQVTIACPNNYGPWIENYGLGFCAITDDFSKYTERMESAGQTKATNPIQFFLSFRKLFKSLQVDLEAAQHKAWKLCAQADLLLYNPMMANA